MDSFAALRPLLHVAPPLPSPRPCGDGERWCRGCDEVKPLTEFYPNGRRTRSGAEGRSYRCKRCDIARISESRRG